MAALEIHNVRKEFGSERVLKDVSISIDSGEFLILVGPSGCGKSTLMNAIAGLEPVTSGNIYIDGEDVTWRTPAERDIAMVFQSYALYPSMTVRQNISFGLEMRKVPKAEREAAVERVADLLQISHLLERKPAQLSGGQRQRVAMGRALAREPKVYLFDEPLSNLDAKLRVDMRTEIKKLHQRLGTTIVYVTHDQVEAMTLADKIVVLNRGHVEQVGSPHELYQRPATKFVAGFIGSPTMNFMPAELLSGTADGCRVKAAGVGEVSLPQAGDAYSKGTSLTLGVRPEHLRLEAPQGDNCFDIVNVEYLGNEVYVYLEPKEGSTLLIHRSEAPSQWQEGQQVSLVPDTEHVHLFDESGAALILSATRTAA